MPEETRGPLKVFLCHASGDKAPVRDLYRRLVAEGVDAWLDQEKLMPGQDWQLEIPRAVREADVVVVCLSNNSVTKEGYVQKEIKFALDSAKEKPEGTIFLIPVRLDDCPVPERLKRWQWVDLFESNGYERLMRSLRLRADKIGASFENSSYVDEGLAQRIDQLYTEGLAAFWVEDWDKSCYCFQTILRYVPHDLQASAKLEEAQRQKYLNALYVQALEAQKNEEWNAMVETLERLTIEAADYKDSSQLLKDAQKKNRLARLYDEARKLHKAQQWHAVVRVFEHIAVIEPDYQDPDGLLPSADDKVAELKRLNELNILYGRGVREMDSGHWQEAYTLLKQIQDAEPAFLETERLLAKAEIEVKNAEKKQRREAQISTLYEQARGLFRSQMWPEALGKLEEIRKLDEQFSDPDQIARQAQVELERKEQEIERHNKLTTMYAEAVRLLRGKKYQDALEKWQEIVKIDPKYPDQQNVQAVSKKKLAELTKSSQGRSRTLTLRQVGIVSSLVITLAIIIWGASRFLTLDYGNLIYEEKFDSVGGWELEGSKVENGTLIIRPNSAVYPFKFDATPNIYTDFILEAQFSNPEGSSVMSFYLRYQHPPCTGWNCSIQVAIDFTENAIVGRRVQGATSYQDITPVKSIQIDPKQWNKITIKAEGNNYEVYMNDDFIMSFTDDTYESGTFVLDNGSKEIKIDDIRIYDLP
jgi:outer membrane protein assembly factor BamD (BamD/ComL family)